MYNAIRSPLMQLAKDDIRVGSHNAASNGNGNGNGNGKSKSNLDAPVAISTFIPAAAVKPASSTPAPAAKSAPASTPAPAAKSAPASTPAPVAKSAPVAPAPAPASVAKSAPVAPAPAPIPVPSTQERAEEITSYIRERAEEITKLIQERCLWQFHSRAWDREENINGVLTKTSEILTGKNVTLETLIDRGFYADGKILAYDLTTKFSWLNQMDNEQKKTVIEFARERLLEIVVTNSLNGELHHSLY
jgi:V-containing nitrogenase delta subunit